MSAIKHLFCLVLVIVATGPVFGLGGDIPSDKPYTNDKWPEGVNGLVNTPNWVHGLFVNAADYFYFEGDHEMFLNFLRRYSKVKIEAHKVKIEPGAPLAKSPWADGPGKRCDWMMMVVPRNWIERDRNANGYVVEITVWAEGRLVIDELDLPEGIEVEIVKGDQ